MVEGEGRFENPMTPEQEKRKECKLPWREDEDLYLQQQVGKFQCRNWNAIAGALNEMFPMLQRTGKQCRERWHNQIDPQISQRPWLEMEENVFLKAHKTLGNKWSEIAKLFPGRKNNRLKNHFYSLMRKVMGQIKRKDCRNFSQLELMQVHYIIELVMKYLGRAERNEGSADDQRNGSNQSTNNQQGRTKNYLYRLVISSELTLTQTKEYQEIVERTYKVSSYQALAMIEEIKIGTLVHLYKQNLYQPITSPFSPGAANYSPYSPYPPQRQNNNRGGMIGMGMSVGGVGGMGMGMGTPQSRESGDMNMMGIVEQRMSGMQGGREAYGYGQGIVQPSVQGVVPPPVHPPVHPQPGQALINELSLCAHPTYAHQYSSSPYLMSAPTSMTHMKGDNILPYPQVPKHGPHKLTQEDKEILKTFLQHNIPIVKNNYYLINSPNLPMSDVLVQGAPNREKVQVGGEGEGEGNIQVKHSGLEGGFSALVQNRQNRVIKPYYPQLYSTNQIIPNNNL